MQMAIKAIGNDMQNPQLRLAVAEAAQQLALKPEFDKWHKAALTIASDEQAKSLSTEPAITYPPNLLVPIPTAFGASSASGSGGDGTDLEEATTETVEPSESEEAKSKDSSDTSGDNSENATEESTKSDEPVDQPPAE
jgi:hypothetical protein